MNACFKLMLKGSALSALALVTAAAGCSDSNKDTTPGAGGDSGGKAGSASQAGGMSKAGTANAAGDGTGGTNGGAMSGGAAGTDAGAGGVTTETGGAGDGGAGGAASDPAIARFCNDLTFGTQQNPTDTTMVLEIGEGADKVTFTATTGHCSPVDGAACTPIPIGTDVPVALFDADDLTTAIDSGTIDTASGENWIFYTDLSTDAQPAPVIAGAPTTEVACVDVTYSDVYP